jgi:hypothetical protein
MCSLLVHCESIRLSVCMLKFYRVTAGSRDLRKLRFDYILYIAENNNINKKTTFSGPARAKSEIAQRTFEMNASSYRRESMGLSLINVLSILQFPPQHSLAGCMFECSKVRKRKHHIRAEKFRGDDRVRRDLPSMATLHRARKARYCVVWRVFARLHQTGVSAWLVVGERGNTEEGVSVKQRSGKNAVFQERKKKGKTVSVCKVHFWFRFRVIICVIMLVHARVCVCVSTHLTLTRSGAKVNSMAPRASSTSCLNVRR